RPAYEIVRAHWQKVWDDKKLGGSFDAFWRKSIHDGIIAGTAFEPKTVTLKTEWQPRSEPRPSQSVAGEYEIIFRPDPAIHDGRYANNACLEELPKPLTKPTWDNAALVSPNTA